MQREETPSATHRQSTCPAVCRTQEIQCQYYITSVSSSTPSTTHKGELAEDVLLEEGNRAHEEGNGGTSTDTPADERGGEGAEEAVERTVDSGVRRASSAVRRGKRDRVAGRGRSRRRSKLRSGSREAGAAHAGNGHWVSMDSSNDNSGQRTQRRSGRGAVGVSEVQQTVGRCAASAVRCVMPATPGIV